jgi:hypothetical protein
MNVPKKRKNYSMVTKQCQFVGCDKQYKGNNVSKYCKLHRQAKFKKELYRKPKEKVESINQVIKHTYSDEPVLQVKCELEGCNNEFNIQLFHAQYLYPKYCPDHRNEFKRNLFLKQQSI